MFGFNTGIFSNVGGAVSGAFDRFISFVETIIDTVKAKIATLWEEKPLVGAVIAVVSAVCLVGVIMFLPAVVGAVRGVGSALIKGLSKVMSVVIDIGATAAARVASWIGRLVKGRARDA